VLIATTQKTHVEIGELMGIGWEWERRQKAESKLSNSPLFLLANQRRDAPEIAPGTLDKTLSQLERPLDLWLVNFRAPVNLEAQKCQVESGELPAVDGYEYQVYHCS